MPGRYGSGAIMKRGFPATAKVAGAETTSTTGPQVQAGEFSTVVATVAVTAASGTTPTMTVVIEGSTDGTNWFTLGTVGANGYSTGSVGTAPSNFTGAATTVACFAAPEFVRSRSVIAGTTPSFTYSVGFEIGGG